jgi:CspA family cold shock protein
MSLQTGDVLKGTVKRFNPKFGYGFVQMSGEQSEDNDVFIHQSDIDMEGFRFLNVGEEVEFTLEITDENMLKARHARLLSERLASDSRPPPSYQQHARNGGGGNGGSRPPLVDAGQRALVRVERMEAQLKKMIEILAKDVDGDVVLTAADIQDIYTAADGKRG